MNPSQVGINLTTLYEPIKTCKVGDKIDIRQLHVFNDFFPSNTKHVYCSQRIDMNVEPGIDIRTWALSLPFNIDEPCTQVVFATDDDVALTKENGGYICYVPFSHTMQSKPTADKLSKTKFRNPKNHKLYDMKQMFLQIEPGMMGVFDRWLWKSIGFNETMEPTKITVVSFKIKP